MTPHGTNALRLVLALAAVTALAFPNFAAADRSTWVGVESPTMLQEKPGPDGEPVVTVPAKDQEGEAIVLPAVRTAARSGAEWLKVRFGGTVGWIPSADAIPSLVDPLPLTLRQRLAALTQRAGAAGVLVADSNGRPLFARNAARKRILASNTKLFVTGAAVNRFGPRIRGLLGRILRPSDNDLAQRLLVRLGRTDPSEGADATEQFARDQGSRVRIADGSGLSRANRSTPADVVNFLVGMRRHTWFETWLGALPISGRTGTLAYRLRATAAETACQAKTGTLHDVSTLSGYCTTGSGRRVVFSLLMNNIDPPSGRALQDRMLASVVALG